MSNLKCPFCQQEYIITKDDSCFGQQRCVCRNPNCEFDGWHFPIKLVSELIRTRKALDVAVDALKSAKTRLELINNSKFANLNNVLQIQSQCEVLKINEALDQITALEQKDVK